MTLDSAEGQGSQRFSKLLQTVVGLLVGLVAAWALLQVLPMRSGAAVVITSLAVTLGIALVLALCVRRLRIGAIAFAVSATLINLLVGVVVAF